VTNDEILEMKKNRQASFLFPDWLAKNDAKVSLLAP
jgi:hypothetical protein